MTFIKTALFRRLLLFALVFFLISGLSGSWLISTGKLLFPFYFSIYGSAGKVLLFAMACFLLMTKGKVFKIPITQSTLQNYILLVGSALSLLAFFIFANNLLLFKHFDQTPVVAFAAHAMLWLSGLCATLGVFGEKYLLAVLKVGWKAAVISGTLAIIFYFAFGYIFKLWPLLSNIVLYAVVRLLRITIPNVKIVPPLTIQLPQFSVTVGEYCSGIESLFLISVLYFLIGCLEWFSLHKIRFALLYCPLIIGMFGLNIVRVYGIIQAGIWFGPEIAAKLFHTYLGIILFMAYFFLFWKFFARFLLISTSKKGAKIV